MRTIIICLVLAVLTGGVWGGLRPSQVAVYWEGYPEKGNVPFPLEDVSSLASTVIIAFSAPAVPIFPNNVSTQPSLGISAATYGADALSKGIQRLRFRNPGTQVLMSIMDTPTVQWSLVDLPVYAHNLAVLVEDWNLDGIDIDAESTTDNYVPLMIDLIGALRHSLGPNRTISFTTYGELSPNRQILKAASSLIDRVQLLSYDLSFQSAVQQFRWFETLVHGSMLSIGVSVTENSLADITQMGNWLYKRGYSQMVLWSTTQDIRPISGEANNTWLNTISESL